MTYLHSVESNIIKKYIRSVFLVSGKKKCKTHVNIGSKKHLFPYKIVIHICDEQNGIIYLVFFYSDNKLFYLESFGNLCHTIFFC